MISEEDFESVETEVVPKNQLQVIIKETNLEPQLAEEFKINFEEHFNMASTWAKKAKKIIVTDPSQTILMEEARTARLFLRKKRLEIENFRVEKKEYYLKAGRAIDKVASFLKDTIIPTEEHLNRQENFVKLQKEAEDARLLAKARAEEEVRIAEEAKRESEEKERLRKENEELRKEMEENNNRIKEEQRKIQEESNKKIEEANKIARQAENELLIKKQEDLKAEANKAREEERLAKAGDTELLSKLYFDIEEIKFPDVKSQINKRIIADAKSYLGLALIKIKPAILNEEI